jgi:hypothetical protein
MQQMLLGILLVLTTGWLIIRIRRNKAEALAEKLPKVVNSKGAFHAVSLKYSKNACTAAKEMTGRRFLSNAAPRLPLPGCDVLECRCKFMHHSDRRSQTNRRNPFAPGGFGEGTGTFQQNRRSRPDRRNGTGRS